MFRKLTWAVAMAVATGCGGEADSVLVVGGQDSRAEAFVDASEESLLRTAPTHDERFDAAGVEFNVPPALLKALSYSLTRYEMVDSEGDFEGAAPTFGLMALSGQALTDGARLANVTEEDAKREPSANVRAAAAWLDAQAKAQGIERTQLTAWTGVIGAYANIEAPEARVSFVKGEVYSALRLGVGKQTLDLEATGQQQALEAEIGEYAEVTQALSRAPDYGGAVWRPSPNYSTRANGLRPQLVVIHTCEGAYSGCWGWLSNTAAQASAHYVVNTTGTEVSQLVREADKAWHVAANYSCSLNSSVKCNLNGINVNNFSVGIEHAGYASQASWNGGQIDASARLTCDITKSWGIPRDRQHIVGHGQLQPYNRTDPGRNWPWSSYIQKVNAFCNSTPPTPPPTPTPTPSGAIIIDSNNANNNQARGYLQVSANWTSSTNVAGYYGTGYWYARTAAISDGAAFFFKLDRNEARTIDAWWTAATDRSASATFVAFNAQGQRVGDGAVNQQVNGGKWNQVGRFNFTAGWNKVVLSRWQAPGKVVIADAIRVR
ncbi:MAG: N-acetylmuramoyl-L-alanine amidase [Myxococcales bacterium]|nr:N-acetylmuramoyl-L-alanine amidase [Myxococcales bacterium]